MKLPKFGPILLAVVLFGILIFTPVRFLLPLISDKKVNDAATALSSNMFQGSALQKKMLEDPKFLPLYGSSELSRLDVYHPSNYFRANPEGFTPFLVGRGGTQSIIQFLSLAATGDALKNKKVVFILSPQWFAKDGITDENFTMNMSNLQVYDFIFNTSISTKDRKYVAKRLLEYPIVKKDTLLKTMLEGIIHDDIVHTAKAKVVTPLAFTYRNILERKDIFTALTEHKKPKTNVDSRLKNLSWQELYERAERAGEKETLSNPFGIIDSYYEKQIAAKLSKLKGDKANESYDVSPEYQDLQMIMDLFKKNHTQALFISIPVNGPWYDYREFPKERRQSYYKKITDFVQSNGFEVADLSAHEYDRHFMKDTIHVGWKGWVYIDQALRDFAKEKK